MEIRYEHTLSVTDYNNLRASAGWGKLPEKQAQAGIDNSAFVVTAVVEDKTIAMARVLSDSGCVAFILDVAVYPEYQGKGIGKEILSRVMSFINDSLVEGEISYVGLMAAKEREGFYKQFGFVERPNEHHGAGMTQWIRKEEKK